MRIQGSRRLDPNALHQSDTELPADGTMFVYCTCVRQATSVRVAGELQRMLREKRVARHGDSGVVCAPGKRPACPWRQYPSQRWRRFRYLSKQCGLAVLGQRKRFPCRGVDNIIINIVKYCCLRQVLSRSTRWPPQPPTARYSFLQSSIRTIALHFIGCKRLLVLKRVKCSPPPTATSFTRK